MGQSQKKASERVVLDRVVRWLAPPVEPPDFNMMVLVKTNLGINYAIVYVDDDGRTLLDAEYHDVWTAWEWQDVTAYCPVDDLIPAI